MRLDNGNQLLLIVRPVIFVADDQSIDQSIDFYGAATIMSRASADGCINQI